MVRILLDRGLEIALSATILATVVFLLAFALDPRSGDKVAHAWAQGMRIRDENVCPTYFGNSFWFACAGEVRRHSPPATAADAGHGQPLPQ